MLNSSVHCARQRQAIAALGPAGGRGEHASACWDLINPNWSENCKRNQDVFAAAFPVIADAQKERERSSPQPAQPHAQPHAAAGRYLLVKKHIRAKHFSGTAKATGTNSTALQEQCGWAKPRYWLGSGSKDLPVLCSSLQLLLLYSPSAVKSVACIHKFRCADSHSLSHSSQHSAATLFMSAAATEFFHPPAPIKGGKHHKRPRVRFLIFLHKERCTKPGVCHNCLVLLF